MNRLQKEYTEKYDEIENNIPSPLYQLYLILAIIPIKSVLARVTHDINMNTITIAIRNYCLQEQQSSHRNFLLNFFLLC